MASRLEGLRQSYCSIILSSLRRKWLPDWRGYDNNLSFNNSKTQGRKWLPDWRGYDIRAMIILLRYLSRKWLPDWRGYDSVIIVDRAFLKSKMASRLEGLRLILVTLLTSHLVENGFQTGGVTTTC